MVIMMVAIGDTGSCEKALLCMVGALPGMHCERVYGTHTSRKISN